MSNIDPNYLNQQPAHNWKAYHSSKMDAFARAMMPQKSKPDRAYLVDKQELDRWKLGECPFVDNRRILLNQPNVLAYQNIAVNYAISGSVVITEEQASICESHPPIEMFKIQDANGLEQHQPVNNQVVNILVLQRINDQKYGGRISASSFQWFYSDSTQTLQTLKTLLSLKLGLNLPNQQANQIRIWKPRPQLNLQDYYNSICESQTPVQFPGPNLDKFNDKILATVKQQGITMNQDEFLVVEIGTNIFQTPQFVSSQQAQQPASQKQSAGQCFFCQKANVQIYRVCPCQRHAWCSPHCLSQDRQHLVHCPKMQLILKDDRMLNLQPADTDAMRGYKGLENLGNTCYMNSAMQCLANVPHFRKFFLSQAFVKEVNYTCEDGTKGEMSTLLARLFDNLHHRAGAYFKPHDFWMAVRKHRVQFDNTNQQDSQDFLQQLFGLLNEDLNRVQHKPKDELHTFRGEDRSLHSYYKTYYQNQNQSIVSDLFQGFFKQTLTCQGCNKNRISYTPFNTLQVPIPKENFSFFFIPSDLNLKVMRLTIHEDKLNSLNNLQAFTQGTATDLKKLMSWEIVGQECKFEDIKLAYVKKVKNHFKFERWIGDTESLTQIRQTRGLFLFAYEVQRSQREEMVYIPLQVTVRDFKDGQGYEHNDIIPRMLSIPKSDSMQTAILLIYNQFWPIISQFNLNQVDLDQSRDDANQTTKPLIVRVVSTGPGIEKCLLCEKFSCDNCVLRFGGADNQQVSAFKDFMVSMYSGLLNEFQLQVVLYGRQKAIVNNIKQRLHQYGNKSFKLTDCFELFKQPETIHDYQCDTCQQKQTQQKVIQLSEDIPFYLVVSLNRFRDMVKIDTMVNYPTKNFKVDDSGRTYSLIGIVQHHGDLGGGHYTSKAWNDQWNKWLFYNDENVSVIGEQEIKFQKDAYVLIYQLDGIQGLELDQIRNQGNVPTMQSFLQQHPGLQESVVPSMTNFQQQQQQQQQFVPPTPPTPYPNIVNQQAVNTQYYGQAGIQNPQFAPIQVNQVTQQQIKDQGQAFINMPVINQNYVPQTGETYNQMGQMNPGNIANPAQMMPINPYNPGTAMIGNQQVVPGAHVAQIQNPYLQVNNLQPNTQNLTAPRQGYQSQNSVVSPRAQVMSQQEAQNFARNIVNSNESLGQSFTM